MLYTLGTFTPEVKSEIQKLINDGYYKSLGAGTADQLASSIATEDRTPYIFRKAGGGLNIGTRKTEKIVGGTIVWNQLIKSSMPTARINNYTVSCDGYGRYTVTCSVTPSASNGAFTISTAIPSNHAVLIIPNGADEDFRLIREGFDDVIYTTPTIVKQVNPTNTTGLFKLKVLTGKTYNGQTARPQVFDLTQMFGMDVADILYESESVEPGSGVEMFKKLFPEEYYGYNTGTLMSVNVQAHRTAGINLFDKNTKIRGYINYNNGEVGNPPVDSVAAYWCTDYIPVLSGENYYINCSNSSNSTDLPYSQSGAWYDEQKNFISGISSYGNGYEAAAQTAPSNAKYLRCTVVYMSDMYSNVDTFCISRRNDVQEDYDGGYYPLSNVEMHGIVKCDNVYGLYYDGDEYTHDGKLTHRYQIAKVSDFTWTKTTATNIDIGYYFKTGIAPKKRASINIFTNAKETVVSPISGITATVQQFGSNIDNMIFGAGDTAFRWIDGSCSDAAAFMTKHGDDYIIYELDQSFEEQKKPYPMYQTVNKYGEEEYICEYNGDVKMPVGHVSLYQTDLRKKLEDIPEPPTTNGTYKLVCVVSNGTPTMSWVAN